MVNKAHGFLSDDGTFHNTHDAAELHESLTTLADRLRPDGIDPEKFIHVVTTYYEEVFRAVKALGKTRDKFTTPGTGPSPGIDTEGARSTTPLVEQPFDQFKSVPDIRPRSQRKTVRS